MVKDKTKNKCFITGVLLGVILFAYLIFVEYEKVGSVYMLRHYYQYFNTYHTKDAYGLGEPIPFRNKRDGKMYKAYRVKTGFWRYGWKFEDEDGNEVKFEQSRKR